MFETAGSLDPAEPIEIAAILSTRMDARPGTMAEHLPTNDLLEADEHACEF